MTRDEQLLRDVCEGLCRAAFDSSNSRSGYCPECTPRDDKCTLYYLFEQEAIVVIDLVKERLEQ